MPARFSRQAILAIVALLLTTASAAASPLAAQTRGVMTTRAELEAQADAAERSGRGDEAAVIRRRLVEGDFGVGDRIVLALQADSSTRDTLTVRDGQMLRVRDLPEISLKGVLRSELKSRLTSELARYIREPRVETESLIRLALLGEVARPGFYWTTADVLVSDVIMNAGGPSASADLSRTSIRRNSRELLSKDAVHAAIARGATLDQVGLRAGDEILVQRKSERNLMNTTTLVLGLVVSIASAAALLSR